ncbi:unnamed protein product [Urochloa humidicola]
MPRIRHAWLWRRHYLYYRLQAAVSSYIPVNNLFSDECLKAGKPLDIYQKRTLQTSGNQEGQRYQMCCGPKHGPSCDGINTLKGHLTGRLCEKSAVADITGSMVGPFDSKLLFHQRGTFPIWKSPAPLYLSRRHFSSKPDLKDGQPFKPNSKDGQLSNADVICMDDFSGPGPGDSILLLQNVTVAANEVMDKLDLDTLKAEFERDIRPLLVSHCLMLPHPIDHVSTAFLGGQAHKFAKSKPLFLTSLDIMVRLKSLKEWQRKPMLDFIIKKRVFVKDEWHLSYGNIELMEYDFEESNSEFVRGECDAAFTPSGLLGHAAGRTSSRAKYQSAGGTTSGAKDQATGVTAASASHQAAGGTRSGVSHQAAGDTASSAIHQADDGTASGAIVKTGMAKLAIIIWKGRKLLWAEMFDGITCQNSNIAEILAALALLMKCEKLKLDKVKLWTDSARTIGCINGSETIKDDENRDKYLLLRSMHTRFTKLVAVRKSRELMFLADQLLKLEGLHSCYVNDAIELQLPYLSGCPLFCITRNHNTNLIMKSFVPTLQKLKDEGYVYINADTFFCQVAKDNKFETLQRIRKALVPNSVEVVMDRSKLNSQHVDQLTGSMCTGKMHEVSQSTISFCEQISIEIETHPRNLVVVWDACVPLADYSCEDSCTIIFAEAEEIEGMQNSNIMEMNPETYFHLHRVVHEYNC